MYYIVEAPVYLPFMLTVICQVIKILLRKASYSFRLCLMESHNHYVNTIVSHKSSFTH